MTADRAHAAAHGGAVPNGPAPQRRSRPGRHLRPVERPTRRRSPAVPVLVGAGMVLAALFGLAVMHALLIGGQLRLDETQRAVASEAEEVRRLRLRVAELESPDRVLEVARDRLGMVPAADVGYLLPVGVETGDDSPARVDAADRPADDEVPVVGTVSPDRPVQEGATENEAPADGDAVDGEAATDDPAADDPVDQDVDQDVEASADGGFDALEGGPEGATE